MIDVKHNKHGESLMEFLKDSKCCVMNGRFHENLDSCNNISTRGKSVIDYCICPHEHLKFCTNFEVQTVSDVIDKFLLNGLFNSKCKMSDHSIVVVNITTSYGRNLYDNTLMDHDMSSTDNCINMDNEHSHKQYLFDDIPKDYMCRHRTIVCVYIRIL